MTPQPGQQTIVIDILPNVLSKYLEYLECLILNKTDCKLLELTNSSLSQTLLYGIALSEKENTTLILNATTEYILSTERFEETLI